jgi:hypothetical protein
MITSLLLAAALSGAPATGRKIDVYSLGIGNESCAHWLSTPVTEQEGKAWILGYWTATNVWVAGSHTVGKSTDGEGIIAETKLVCAAEPSTGLMYAVSKVYVRLSREHK